VETQAAFFYSMGLQMVDEYVEKLKLEFK